MKYNNFLICDLTIYDKSKIKLCLETIISELDKELFVTPSIEYIDTIISGYGYSAGVFLENTLVGFASIVFPKLGKHNLGYCLNFKDEDLLSVVQLEHIYLYPEYRGKGLAKRLIFFLLNKINSKYSILLSTISPNNISSLSLAFSIFLKIVGFANIYGVNRYIMYRNLSCNSECSNQISVEIQITKLNEIVNLLNLGYVGISFDYYKNFIRFIKGVEDDEKISN